MNQPNDLLAEDLFQRAIKMFDAQGYDQVDLDAIAADADCDLDELYVRFPRKEAFIVRLYEQMALELETLVPDLPTGTLVDRYRLLLSAKVTSVRTHGDLITRLLPSIINPGDRLGAMGTHGNRIRSRIRSVCEAVVLGASDCPVDESAIAAATRRLYAVHLAVVFVALQDPDDETLADDAVALGCDAVAISQKMTRVGIQPDAVLGALGIPAAQDGQERSQGTRLNNVLSRLLEPPSDRVHYSRAENILRDIFRFRRLQPGAGDCAEDPCAACLAVHLRPVEAALASGEPITFVLPAFPAKSPNTEKVLGTLPDLAEELALRFLQERCDAVADFHPAGARVVICSDGRVFGDVVAVPDHDITAYREHLVSMVSRLGLKSIEMFDLDDIVGGMDFDEMRRWLVERYAEPIESLRERSAANPASLAMFNGIHRFMFEDLVHRQPELSRTQARKLSKGLAYEVIQRSNAWSRLVASQFLDGVRLSIHPQPAHSNKIGILLTDSDDVWLTPWHGVALLERDKFRLVRRAEAEEKKAVLVERAGRPSHYESSK